MALRTTLVAAWPLFLGFTLMMAGSGLQGTLLGVRATAEGFNVSTIGVVMSAYYIGYMGGTGFVPAMLKNVGHIRVFTALAALAAIAVLIQGMFVTPLVWGLARVMSGMAYAGLYIVVESWLNNMAAKETRGKIMALYLLATYLGMVAGQFMLNFADPSASTLFMAASILISLSLIPIALSKRPAPEFSKPQRMSPRQLWRASPLGVFAVTLSGLANSVILSIGAVYASERGFTVGQVSLFMSALLAGGVAFQIPVGHLSDRTDRRKMIIAISLGAAVSALLCLAASRAGGIPFYLAAFLMGGFSMTVYGLCVAYTNDHLQPHQYVSASSSMLMFNGMGAIAGPTLATGLMDRVGPDTYFPLLTAVFLSVTAFGIYRATRREAPSSQAGYPAGTPDPVVMHQDEKPEKERAA